MLNSKIITIIEVCINANYSKKYSTVARLQERIVKFIIHENSRTAVDEHRYFP